MLEALGRVIEARLAPGFAPGAAVDWLIPPGSVVLHRRDRPSRGEHENPVAGTVAEYVLLGDQAQVAMEVAGASRELLSFAVPRHVAERNRLGVGEAIAVSLLATDIHLMPARGRDG
jgi:molybdate transport system ATP-binding protein